MTVKIDGHHPHHHLLLHRIHALLGHDALLNNHEARPGAIGRM